jgi:hypothetical protein
MRARKTSGSHQELFAIRAPIQKVVTAFEWWIRANAK